MFELPKRQQTIALIDGLDDGHHLTILRQYARTLLEMGHRVVELLPDPGRVDTWFQETCANQRDRLFLYPFRHEPVASPYWKLRRIWPPLADWRHAARAIAEAERRSGWRVDLVFFCWLDPYVVGGAPLCRLAIPHIMRRPWSGLFFHPWHLRAPDGDPSGHYRVSTGILRTRGCRGVAVLDEGIAERLRALLGRPVIALPDDTDESLPAVDPPRVQHLRAAIGGRKVIGLFGELSRRKGVLGFINTVTQARDRNWVFLMAGALGDTQRASYSAEAWRALQDIIHRPPPNLIVLPERMEPESEFNAVIKLCDAIFAAYETFGHSSGILTKAAAFHIPILVSPGYCMAERVSRYRIGLTAEPNDTTAVIASLETMLDPEALARRLGPLDFEGCHRAHSEAARRAAMEQVVALA